MISVMQLWKLELIIALSFLSGGCFVAALVDYVGMINDCRPYAAGALICAALVACLVLM